ncbi:MAG: lipoyl synthase [Nitrospinota bacterium]|nr:lipoyl synthase [Nitrospinota bacterium]
MIKPGWLKKPPVDFLATSQVRQNISLGRLNTVCHSARCPNLGECFSRGTATFMILGDECSRSCGFCAVPHGKPAGRVDLGEPERVAQTAARMGLSHVVVTSVTRDDLVDGGAGIFARTIWALRREAPSAKVEVLTPDFMGNLASVDTVAGAGPDLFNHNMETVRRLYGAVRPEGEYTRSLQVIRHVRAAYPAIRVKSGFMLGLGEEEDEVIQLMEDLKWAGCQVVTIGQYLSPSRKHLPVVEYIPPERFQELERIGLQIGFDDVFAGPFVRSSYMAGERGGDC